MICMIPLVVVAVTGPAHCAEQLVDECGDRHGDTCHTGRLEGEAEIFVLE